MNILCVSLGLGAVDLFLRTHITGEIKLGYIATASKVFETAPFVDTDLQTLRARGYELIDIDVSRLTPDKFTNKIANVDALFVSGGNTFFLLQELRRTGNDVVLIEAINSGLPYIGASAGAAVLAPDIDYVEPFDDRDLAPQLTSNNALEVISFYPLPHYGIEETTEIYNEYMKDNGGREYVAFTNNQAVVINNGSAYKIISSAID